MSKSFLRSALFSAAALAGAAMLPQMASASCAAHPTLQSGRYVNTDAATRSITTVDLDFVCGAAYRDNGDGTGTLIHGGDPHWTVRLWGSCHPSDCDWGETRAQEAAGRGSLLGAYDQGFARRDVTVVPEGAHVLVIVSSTYTDGRAARTSVNRMRRQ